MTEMFFGCSSLNTINLSSFNSDNLESKDGIFNNIPNTCTLICNDKIFLKIFEIKQLIKKFKI